MLNTLTVQGTIKPIGIHPTEVNHGDIVGNKHHFTGDHHRSQKQEKQEVLAEEVELSKGIGGERTEDHFDEHDRNGDQKAILK